MTPIWIAFATLALCLLAALSWIYALERELRRTRTSLFRLADHLDDRIGAKLAEEVSYLKFEADRIDWKVDYIWRQASDQGLIHTRAPRDLLTAPWFVKGLTESGDEAEVYQAILDRDEAREGARQGDLVTLPRMAWDVELPARWPDDWRQDLAKAASAL